EILPHHPAAQSSMVAWFKSEDSGPAWRSAVGSWQGRVTKGSVTRKVEAGNGATRPVAYLAGDPNSGYDFGKIMKPDFTICSISRYADYGVMEVITWNRALSEDEMWTSMEYLNWKLQAHLAHQPSAESSMVAWFKSEDSGPAWKSAVGSWEARVTKGSVTRRFNAGSGAAVPVAYLAGDSNAGYDFGKIMKPDFTICSISRYA
ncbi:unnamed protein product, partial [Symbiodinium sp. CCMP2456]